MRALSLNAQILPMVSAHNIILRKRIKRGSGRGGDTARTYECPVLLTLLYQATLSLAEYSTTLHSAIQPNGVFTGIRVSTNECNASYDITIK